MTPSAFVRGCAPGATRAARAAWHIIGVTAITTCTRLDAASVSTASVSGASLVRASASSASVSAASVPAASVSAEVSRAADSPAVASSNAPPGMYDALMAQRGKVHFKQYCAECHVKQKRTTSRPAKPYIRLRYLGFDSTFFADGSAKSLEEVVGHYDEKLQMRLSKPQQADLVEYLKSH